MIVWAQLGRRLGIDGQMLNVVSRDSNTHGLVAVPSLRYIEHASICDSHRSSIELSIRLGFAVHRQRIFFAMPKGYVSTCNMPPRVILSHRVCL